MAKSIKFFILLFIPFVDALAQPANDNYANAVDVTSLINSCSSDAAYTTVGATSDLNAASCWNTSPNYNVWFKFQATTANMKITIDRDGSTKGTIARSQVALWEADGTTEVGCKRYVGTNDVVVLEEVGTLTIGNWYYISVDAYSGYYGTFTLCLADNDISYDFYEGAVDVSGIINGCSADAEYTTYGMTPDKDKGSCWNTGANGNYNVWFKFQATTANMKITIDRDGSTKGTIARSQVALWEADGTTEVGCKRYVGTNDVVVLEEVGTLTIGNWYYISVDAYSGYYGTFTLCLADNDISYDFYEGAVDVSGIINGCSADAVYTTYGMTPDKDKGSCWNTGANGNYNVWFKFQATTANMKITIDRDGSTKGTIARSQVALWEADGTTEVGCKRYVGTNDVVVLEEVGTLTIGNWYYISVDAYSGYYGTFTLCLADNDISYDFYEGAVDVSGIINGCSADAEYTTYGMTPDKDKGSCWNTGANGNYNVWFKFQATTANMKITIDRDGSTKGTIARSQVALWEADGTTEVGCKRYVGTNDVVVLEEVGTLTIGNWYYISVDAYSGYYGTFTLCLADNDISYDFYEGAVDVSGIINGCSADAEYTTYGMTPDKDKGSCWNTGANGNYNVWFKFQATTANMKITIDRDGSTKGTIARSQVALWEADGTTEVGCKRYVGTNDVVVLEEVGTLTIGNWYYISVDAYSGYYGTFTLCLADNDISYDFYEGAVDVSGIINGCSADAVYTTYGMTPDKDKGSCWNTGANGNYNVWFKFQATTANMKITVDRDGNASGKGNIRYAQVALWEADGTTEVGCKIYVGGNDVVVLEEVGTLTVDDWYYISVDAYSGYYGNFTLCLADNDISYDFYEGAIDVSGIINGCSADAEYTTYGMTPDKDKGSCWNTGANGNYNVWFKFQATTANMKITVDRDGNASGKGNIRYAQVALWEADGTTEVGCKIYVGGNDVVVLEEVGTLTVDDWYYISVDAYSGYYGNFTLCLADNDISYDHYEGAINVSGIINGCSADGAYTTYGMTPGGDKGSCWNSGANGNYNVWFKFRATTTNMKITVDRDGNASGKGNIRYAQVALWEADGTTEVGCKIYVGGNDVVVLEEVGTLTVGSWYYISVDAYSGYYGNFTLCLADNDISYDHYEGAIELTDLNNWCSEDGVYTTYGMTPGGDKGSCWNTGPNGNYNVWFKFQALNENVSITVDRDGNASGKGNIRYAHLALWEADGTTEVGCTRYVGSNDVISLSLASLSPGNWYYISVDAYSGYYGNFTLCVDNVDTEYYSISDGDWDNGNTWSIVSHAGPAAASYPDGGDIAYIEDHDIVITGNEVCAEVDMTVATDATSLDINGGDLNIAGQLKMTNAGANFDGAISIGSDRSLYVNDKATFTRAGGANAFGVSVATGGNMTVNKDMEWISTGGSAVENTLILNSTGLLAINRDFKLSNTGGVKTYVQSNSTSSIAVLGDVDFVASNDNKIEIELNTSAKLYVGGSITRGSPAYGILDCNDLSTVVYNGSIPQVISENEGSGTGDNFDYTNVEINNSYVVSPQVSMEGDVNIPGILILTDGIIQTTTVKLMTLADGASTTGASNNSFVDGPIKKIGTQDITLPTGDGSIWAPVGLANLTGDASTEFTAEYHDTTPTDPTTFKDQGANTLNNVSLNEYWELTNSGTASNADVTLHWKDQNRCQINDYDELVIAHYDGSEWENIGQDDRVASDPGSITVNDVSTFSPFTFGSTSELVNPLPVELVSFSGTVEENTVLLKWSTASELNNDYFTLERSSDGKTFEPLGQIAGTGTSSTKNDYLFTDSSPIYGISYYRLVQVDYDGQFEYSTIISINIPLVENIMLNVYPNPFNIETTVSYLLPQKTRVRILLNSISGNLVKVLVDDVQSAGYYNIPIAGVAKGMMIIHCNIGGNVVSKKIIKQ